MNLRKLKAKMAERGVGQKDLERLTGISHTTMNRKLNHAQETLTLRNIMRIRQALNLTQRDVWEIFICFEGQIPARATK